MNVEIDAGGRRRAVIVERRQGEWSVTVDGRAVTATVTEVGSRWSLLIGPADGVPAPAEAPVRRSYEISFLPQGDGGTIVFVDGVPVSIAVADARSRVRRGSRLSSAVAGAPRPIVAPMPGRVVKVLVERGQAVAARQPVVVVEAMKMENELRAPQAGTVAAVHVSEGMSVEAHAVLVVLE